jgi:hypothetical protein
MSLGFRLKRFRRLQIAGKTSELCLIGPEKGVSVSIRRPTAIATEPSLPDVSTANINGFSAIIFFNSGIFLIFYRFSQKALLCQKKSGFFVVYFSYLS